MTTEVDMQEIINSSNSEVPSDQRIITPEGEYTMYVKPGSTKIFEGSSDKGIWKRYNAVAVVDDPQVREVTNLESPTARLSFFLDVNPENGALIMGTNRNTSLGKLLKVTGNDKQGWSYAAIEGVPFKGRVRHVADQRDAEKQHAEVVSFARA